jgi:FRG domain
MFTEYKVSSWEKAKRRLAGFDSTWAFRGHAESKWKLESVLERNWSRADDRAVGEQVAIHQYQRKAEGLRGLRAVPRTRLGLLSEMRHFGAPTRLLDWTKSVFVAAYFAFQQKHPGNYTAIWAVDLAWCKGRAISRIKDLGGAYVGLDIRQDLCVDAIVNEVILANRVDLIAPLVAYEANERLTIQQGLFLCAGNIAKTFEQNIAAYPGSEIKRKCFKILIPSKERETVLRELRAMNITAATLFPGLDGFTSSLNNDLFLLERSPAVLNKAKANVEGALIYLS